MRSARQAYEGSRAQEKRPFLLPNKYRARDCLTSLTFVHLTTTYQKEKSIGDEQKDSCEQEEGGGRGVFQFRKLASKECKTLYERIGFAYKFGSVSFQTWTRSVIRPSNWGSCSVLSV